MWKPKNEQPAFTFEKVFEGEQGFLRARRSAHGIQEELEKSLVGLALSGGGIRSATFNLGILQGLTRIGFLKNLDYLSTVSGGGYIGSWLVAWLHRERFKTVEQGETKKTPFERVKEQLSSGTKTPALANATERFLEPDEIHFLRKYTSYLTPRAGAVSTDTWTLPAIYLRNVLLNLTLLVAVFGALISLALFWFLLCRISASDLYLYAGLLAVLSIVAVGFGVAFMASGMEEVSQDSSGWPRGYLSASLLFIAAITASYWLITPDQSMSLGWWDLARIYLSGWVIGLLPARLQRNSLPKTGNLDRVGVFWTLLFALVAGAAAGGLLHAILYCFRRSGELFGPDFFAAQEAVFGVAALVLVFLLTGVMHIGLAGRALPDDRREWLGRLGAVLMIVTLVWTSSMAIAVYGPVLVEFLRLSDWAVQTRGQLLQWAVGGGWLATTLAGILTGRMASASGNEANLWTRWIARIAPVVFAAGFLVLVSFGVDVVWRDLASVPGPTRVVAANHAPSGKPASPDIAVAGAEVHIQVCVQTEPCEKAEGNGFYSLLTQHLQTFYGFSWRQLLAVLLGCLGAMSLLSLRVDINEFSMHWFYRNRLVRCYLGASVKERHPNPFTGFGPDDLPLSAVMAPKGSTSNGGTASEDYEGPYPILCAALNLVNGKELAWQRRKAASFIFTPKYCGYDLYSTAEPPEGAYRPTREFMGGASLGSAMAISGAAASPNMGYHTSGGLAFLMTVFDVRLGWWAGNTRKERWRQRGPHFALWPLMNELFGRTDDESRWVYLSDGGHFENLGIYELARRRCKYIIACDASQDDDLSFDDLGNAIEKARRDLGVEITIDVSNIRRKKATEKSGSGWSRLHYAIGDIQYPRNAPAGAKLLYIKSSLTGDEPADVLSYHAQHPVFPHDSTADQFFDETQFESYRRLGEYIFQGFRDIAKKEGVEETLPFDKFWEALEKYAREQARIERGANSATNGPSPGVHKS